MGHNSFVYLDDGFGSQPERTSAVAAAFIQRKKLDSSGLLVNEEKSHWVSMQVGEWLGFVINTISMTFRIPEKKVCKLKRPVTVLPVLNSGAQACEARLRSTMGKQIYPSQKIWQSRDSTRPALPPVRPHHRKTNVQSH